MCIALPRKIVEVLDRERAMVALAPESNDQTGTADAVSVALLAESREAIEAMVGQWVLVHAGFALSIVDEEDARSRLQMFAAMRGDTTPLDLRELHDVLHDALHDARPDPRRDGAP
ncbi:hydrogenase expression/formation protein (HUPF/HYPC) [Rhodovulum sp. PH10]|uniref:HypC/HybG/HupF family hydrogenase formation chaperone n=1 Tax=Rhodovulum sp. PH10 TaxID=1187851 RepID=UPI00027C2D6C|nr:HypC/HybG/HupF family hydrogenase formation chaperone [Rhodovulum sp. PH10]EJW09926.1 hydrogenase expression/formation protein (HUPF/HYPC) [Rhodovulum sp. PH10]